ncbi:hypothetical protein LBMAG53_10670 [Planctomycetota bacterium]|nr:hypothetical protein LBMAG53_10670 [Planctomycetota bacterium]
MFAALALAFGLHPHASHSTLGDRAEVACPCAGTLCGVPDPEPDSDHGDGGHCHCPPAVAQLPNTVAPMLTSAWFEEICWPAGPPVLVGIVIPPDPPPARRS